MASVTQYAGLARTWAEDAALVYGPLARHLVARAPVTLDGAVALDSGAGSGVAGDALRSAGAEVVSADREHDMTVYGARPAVTADVTALPFRDGVFDVTVAAFVINHLPDPVAGLAELRRVTRPDGAVLASTFSATRAAAKSAVDEVAVAHGFEPPDWYRDVQGHMAALGSVDAVEAALRGAGFSAWTVTESAVDVGLDRAEDVVRYRLALPQLHGFVTALDEDRRRSLVGEAAAAVRDVGERFAPFVIEALARP